MTTFEIIRDILVNKFGLKKEDIKLSSYLSLDLNLNLTDNLYLINYIETCFQVKFDIKDFELTIHTIQNLINAVEKQVSEIPNSDEYSIKSLADMEKFNDELIKEKLEGARALVNWIDQKAKEKGKNTSHIDVEIQYWDDLLYILNS